VVMMMQVPIQCQDIAKTERSHCEQKFSLHMSVMTSDLTTVLNSTEEHFMYSCLYHPKLLSLHLMTVIFKYP